jgi:putative transposase
LTALAPMADTTNRLEPDPRGRKGRDRPMRGFKGPRSAAWVCRAHDDLAGASPDGTHLDPHDPAL